MVILPTIPDKIKEPRLRESWNRSGTTLVAKHFVRTRWNLQLGYNLQFLIVGILDNTSFVSQYAYFAHDFPRFQRPWGSKYPTIRYLPKTIITIPNMETLNTL